jgi:hypothetical protein
LSNDVSAHNFFLFFSSLSFLEKNRFVDLLRAPFSFFFFFLEHRPTHVSTSLTKEEKSLYTGQHTTTRRRKKEKKKEKSWIASPFFSFLLYLYLCQWIVNQV